MHKVWFSWDYGRARLSNGQLMNDIDSGDRELEERRTWVLEMDLVRKMLNLGIALFWISVSKP